MKPENKRKIRNWFYAWLVWVAFALFFATQQFTQTSMTKTPFWKALYHNIVDLSIGFALSPLVIGLARRLRDRGRHRVWRMLWHPPAALLYAATHTSLLYLAMRGGLLLKSVPMGFWEYHKFNVHFMILTYLVVVGVTHALDYYRMFTERQLRSSRLETQLAKAHLQTLKTQLQPHFLFNALNTISAYVYENRDTAVKMIARLSELLRLSIENRDTQEVPLRRELKFLDIYLEIEQLRFSDRLQVRRRLEPESMEALVPALLLQPLVENAIRHGISPKVEGGTVEIVGRCDGQRLLLTIRDDGVGLDESRGSDGGGIGLRNTRERLERLYGSHQSLRVLSIPGGGVEVAIELPLKRAEEEE